VPATSPLDTIVCRLGEAEIAFVPAVQRRAQPIRSSDPVDPWNFKFHVKHADGGIARAAAFLER
jgi:hypothetical protein